jgi:Cof subfamily protein (haloacid dehalogenase superfamily)
MAAVQAAQQAGVIITLATARRYYNTLQIAIELGVDIPLILCDGSLIMQHPTGEVVHTHLLPAHIAQQAVDILTRYRIQPVVHHMNGNREETWTGPRTFDNEWVMTYFSSFLGGMQRICHHHLCLGHPDPLRVIAFAPEDVIEQLIPEVSALDCSWNITRRGSYGTAEMAIMHRTCSKASGVAALAHLFRIPLGQVMAIGDNNNDLEMLQEVGWGVAMGQATEPVKAAAHVVTTSNAEDGVALAIERYILDRASKLPSNSLRRATCR